MRSLLIFFFLAPLAAIGQEHARILSQETVYEIIDANSAVISETYKIKINSDEGYQFAYVQDYTDRFRKIEEASIEVFSATGQRIKKIRKSEGVLVSFNSSYEISDARVFIMDPDYKNFPFVLDVSVKTKLSGFTALQPWVPRSSFNLAVDQATFKVVYPTTVKIFFQENNVTGKSLMDGDKNVRQFEVSSLPAVERKLRFKDFYETQPRVYVKPEQFKLDGFQGSNQSWATFGDWFYKLNDTDFKLADKTIDFINQQDKSDKKVLIQNIYKYMQDKTRYVSIQLGIGGFRSLPTEDVEKFGYGDCKALTTYMKNMLEYAGVKSNYILVSAGADQPDIHPDFPSNQFNHVFLGIPMASDTVYLECTSQIVPANYVGKFTDDRHVLWIEKGKSFIKRSRVYGSDVNTKAYVMELAVEPSGNSIGKIKTTSGGVFFDDIQLYKLAKEDMIKRINLEKFDYPDFTIKDFKYNQDDPTQPVLREEFLIEVKNLAKVVGDKLVMPLMPATPAKKYITKDETMKYYSIRRAFTITDQINIKLPDNYWVYNIPAPEKIVSQFGSYEFTIEADGTTMKVNRKFTINKGDYTEGKQYDEFKKFFDAIEKFENRKIVLNSKT